MRHLDTVMLGTSTLGELWRFHTAIIMGYFQIVTTGELILLTESGETKCGPAELQRIPQVRINKAGEKKIILLFSESLPLYPESRRFRQVSSLGSGIGLKSYGSYRRRCDVPTDAF